MLVDDHDDFHKRQSLLDSERECYIVSAVALKHCEKYPMHVY
jgi:hypothetical protein